MAAKTGVEHHNAKLTPAKVAEMRAWYAEGSIGILELATEFGIGYTTAREALRGTTWKGAPHPAVQDCPNCHGKGRVVV